MFVLLCVASLGAPSHAQELVTDDVQRMAALLTSTTYRPSARQLQLRYLDPAASDVDRFMDSRGGNAEQLAFAIANRQPEYRRAMELCLPSLLTAGNSMSARVAEVQELLGQSTPVNVYVVFGSGRSGGTADRNSVILALEVLCRFANTPAEAADVLESSLVHELVHHYRFRTASFTGTDNLLRQAMIEGFADFVAELTLGQPSPVERERQAYGLQHEAKIWAEFKEEKASPSLGQWMYGPGAEGQPADLGYWIGKRISEAYYVQAEDKDLALQELLLLDDPESLLQSSGYNPH